MQGLRCSSPSPSVRECWPLWEATTNTTTTATGRHPHTQTLLSPSPRLHFNIRMLFVLFCCRDCLALCCLNSATSIFAGFAVFSVLGFMAHELNLSMHEVASAGELIPFSTSASFIWLLSLSTSFNKCRRWNNSCCVYFLCIVGLQLPIIFIMD